MAKNGSHPSAPVWDGPDYPRVPEGRYQAMAVEYQGPEWIRNFARWSLRLEFELFDDGSRVSVFYNFGNDRNAPKVLRRGNFFKAWTLANGEMPRKGQQMSFDVFMEGQIYTVEVKESRRNSAEEPKSEAEVYSVVTKILDVERGPRVKNNTSANHESFNQESINQKSSNHPIKQSTNQVWPVRENANRGQKVSPQPGEGKAHPNS